MQKIDQLHVGPTGRHNNFSAGQKKTAHAFLCCELEQGMVTWDQTDMIDCIRRAHAQKMLILSNHRSNQDRP